MHKMPIYLNIINSKDKTIKLLSLPQLDKISNIMRYYMYPISCNLRGTFFSLFRHIPLFL